MLACWGPLRATSLGSHLFKAKINTWKLQIYQLQNILPSMVAEITYRSVSVDLHSYVNKLIMCEKDRDKMQVQAVIGSGMRTLTKYATDYYSIRIRTSSLQFMFCKTFFKNTISYVFKQSRCIPCTSLCMCAGLACQVSCALMFRMCLCFVSSIVTKCYIFCLFVYS